MQTKIQKEVEQLMQNNPEFEGLVLRISEKPTAIGITKDALLLNLKYFENFNEEEISSTIAMMGQRAKYFKEFEKAEHKLEYNIAVDIAIGHELIQQGFKLPDESIYYNYPKYHGLSVETIYNSLTLIKERIKPRDL